MLYTKRKDCRSIEGPRHGTGQSLRLEFFYFQSLPGLRSIGFAGPYRLVQAPGTQSIYKHSALITAHDQAMYSIVSVLVERCRAQLF